MHDRPAWNAPRVATGFSIGDVIAAVLLFRSKAHAIGIRVALAIDNRA